MFVATVIVSCVLAAVVALSAGFKLTHNQEIVQQYARLGVPEDRLDQLAVLLLAGAGGLLVGLAWWPMGAAAAAGLAVYFLGAVAVHVRAGVLRTIGTPLLVEALAVAALVLRLGTR
ncbi:DoxX family protein [Streptodolium elevatio]|uniref:DoxX family protein n=1 Tax=Streptodolium elevatio TaxID=3157996 RepID=A0ABV3DJE7_9ACTN